MEAHSQAAAARADMKILTGFGCQNSPNLDGLSSDLVSASLVQESEYKHLFTATASLSGKGVCNAWLIKPELVSRLDDYARFGRGPGDLKDLMHEVFDWPRSPSTCTTRDVVNKGVKFLQQFDVDYDYLEEEQDDIRDHAWIVFFRNVHVEENHQRQCVGTVLVRALLQEISRLAQLVGRQVLAFAKLEKSILQRKAWSAAHELPPERRKKDFEVQEARVQASFWASLAFERLNDGHLFARDLDWLFWSPRARNAALLFDRPGLAFPVDFIAFMEDYLSDCE